MSANEKWPEPKQCAGFASIPLVADFLNIKDAKRAVAAYNATLDMSDPAKEIKRMREALKVIAETLCDDLEANPDGKPCTEFTQWTPVSDYCPSCLARHTLKGKP